MKNAIVLSAFILFMSPVCLLAQTIQKGVITYEQKINIHLSLSEDQKAMKALIPEFMTSQVQLSFKDGVARAKEVKAEQQGGIMISTSSSDLLMNSKENKTYSFAELGQEKFYTESVLEPEKDQLKLLQETKKIGGYECKAAVMESEEDTYKVWYCPALPKYFSPMGLLGVDGMVLQIESQQISYLFKNISEEKVDENLLQFPQGHKKVSDEQLMDLQEEYMEELQEGLH